MKLPAWLLKSQERLTKQMLREKIPEAMGIPGRSMKYDVQGMPQVIKKFIK